MGPASGTTLAQRLRVPSPRSAPPATSAPRLIALVATLVTTNIARADDAQPASKAPAISAAATAGAPGKHCLGEGRSRLLVDQTIVGVLNPMGAEYQLQLFLCVPLIRRPGLLFDYTHVELGLFNDLSPIYVQQGAFAGIAPLSFLQLRAELSAVQLWPLPLDGAGYFPLDSYRADFSDGALPQARARSASGLEASLAATLAFPIPLGRRVTLIVTDGALGEFWSVGQAAFYLNERRDVVLARNDLLVKNTAALLLQVTLAPDVVLTAGATDDATWVPRSGYLANIAAILLSLDLAHRRRGVPLISPFARVGGYTRHAFREGLNLLFGLDVTYELTPRAAAAAP